MTSIATRPVGLLLREWRERRRLSQLELSSRAEISTRHLSFVETGRSRPTPEMILKLTDHLEVPLRERNQLLLAGGYAPAYPQHGLDEPELASVREALKLVLTGHEPYPALVVNRWWELLDANAAVALIVEGCAPHLLEPPVNVLRLSLHPDGMAPRIRNLAQWRAHLLEHLRRRTEDSGDRRLRELHEELRGYPGGLDSTMPVNNVVLPLRLQHERRAGVLLDLRGGRDRCRRHRRRVDHRVLLPRRPGDRSAVTGAGLRSAGVGPSPALEVISEFGRRR